MLAPRSILKHTQWQMVKSQSQEHQSMSQNEWNKIQGPFKVFRTPSSKQNLLTLICQESCLTAWLTGSAGQTDSERPKRPRRTEGCHKDVWEGRKSRGGEFKSKSFTMREWHHLLDIHLLKPNTLCVLIRRHCCTLGIVAFVQMWVISVLVSVSLTLHGSQQGVVMEGPFRYGSNIVAVKPAVGRTSRRQCEDTLLNMKPWHNK